MLSLGQLYTDDSNDDDTNNNDNDNNDDDNHTQLTNHDCTASLARMSQTPKIFTPPLAVDAGKTCTQHEDRLCTSEYCKALLIIMSLWRGVI